MPISTSDPRWVWELDPQRPWGELTKYRGNRQVTNLALTQFTTADALPTNDGVNQIYERVLDPLGSGRMVYRHQIRADRAVGTGWATGTWRSEVSNTNMEPVWGQEYWAAVGVMLGDDFAAAAPTVNIFEYHVPYPQPTPVGISPFTMFAGSANFSAAVRYNAGMPANANDYTTGTTWSAPATRGVWHYFVMNFRLGADNPANFLRMWHRQGNGALNLVVNYTGRIGYNAGAASGDRHNYAKHGLYSWTNPWPSGSTSRTMWSRGFRLIKAGAGIDENEMLALLVDGVSEPEPEPEPTPLWQGVVFPALAKFSPIADGSFDSWAVFASTPAESDNSADVFDPTDVEDSTMLIKRNESTADLRTIYIQLTNTSDGSPVTSALSAGDLKISRAGGAEANTDGVATHRGGGVYAYVLTTDEVATGGAGYVRVAKAGCYARRREFQIVAFDPHDATSLGMSRIDTTISSCLPSAVAVAVWDLADGVETDMTPRQALRLVAAILCGQTEGSDTNSEKFMAAVANHKIRATVTLVGSDRSSVAVDLD